MIEVQGLQKYYGRHQALRGVNLRVDRGEVVGLLGPNGAGKTTMMKLLTGTLSPSAGSVRVNGLDVVRHPTEVRRHLGYLPESAPVYSDMKVWEYLDFVGRVRRLGAAERASATDRALASTGLTDRRDQSIGTLSKGYRQRVGLAQAILHDPDILILDEPTTGLDPNQIVEIRSLIRSLGERKTILLSTHILSEVQASCDRVVIVDRGAIAADGPTDQVTAADGGALLQVVLAPGTVRLTEAQVVAAVLAVPGVRSARVVAGVESVAGEVQLELFVERDVRAAVFGLAVERGLVLLELSRSASSLEEVFRSLTRSDGADPRLPGAGVA